MEIERNIVFIHPLTEKLVELKELIETKSPDAIVYEMESVAEFVQLIGIMEHSVTFSSDLLKTEDYLKKTKDFVNQDTTHNCIVLTSKFPPHILSRLTKAGLNKVFFEKEIEVSDLFEYTNNFFIKHEGGELPESAYDMEDFVLEPTKGKVLENVVIKNTAPSQKNNKLDKEHQKIQTNKNLIIDDPLQNNLQMKRSALGSSFLGSPFDNLQRRNVKQFEPVLKNMKKKKYDFKEVDPKLKKKKKVDLRLVEAGILGNKKLPTFEPVQAKKKKYGKFTPVSPALKKKHAKFVEVQRSLHRPKLREDEKKELKKKKGLFEAVARKLERKRGLFEEVERNINRKKLRDNKVYDPKPRKKFEEFHRNLEKKRKDFEEVERSYEHTQKRKNEAKTKPEKEAIEEELKELEEKAKSLLDEITKEGPEWDKNIDELSREHDLPKPQYDDKDDELDDEEKNKHDDVTKKGPEWDKNIEGINREKDLLKPKNFYEQELDNKKKNEEQEFESKGPEWNKEKEKNETSDEKKKGTQEIKLDTWNDKLKVTEDEEVPWNEIRPDNEINIDTKLKGKVSYSEESKEKMDKNNSATVKKQTVDQLVQTLDYRKFREQVRTGQLSITPEEIKELQSLLYEKELKKPDLTYFKPDTLGLEYIVLYNDLIHNPTISPEHLCRLIQFAYKNEFQSPISFYVFDKNSTTGVKALFEGHKEENAFYTKEDFNTYFDQSIQRWKDIKLPTFSDETYTNTKNEFIYPYFTDGVQQGLCVAHFNALKRNHIDAKKIELLAICLQGVIQDEFLSLNGDKL